MSRSPIQRSLKIMRARGYLAESVERFIPGANIRRDLFGFGDILAIRDNEIATVQSTDGSHLAARVRKIAVHANFPQVCRARIRVLVHGWRRDASRRWTLREIDMTTTKPQRRSP